MSFGIVDVITLLMGLSGFSVQQNPKAPTADTALQYAVPDADVVVQFDAASVIPGNYKVLTSLPSQPSIKAAPEVSKLVGKMISEVEGARGLAKAMTGIDLTTDVSDATLFVQIPAGTSKPTGVVAVRGKFTTAVIDKIAKMGGKQSTKIGGAAMIEMGPDDPAVAVTKDGVLLAGTANLVKDRLADSWKPPVRAPNSTLAHFAEVVNTKPVFSVGFGLGKNARARLARELMGKKNFITDTAQRHKFAAFSVYHDGIGWTWVDSTKAGLDAMAQVSEGTMEVLKAAQIAPRGFSKIMLGALESYRSTDKRVDELIRRKSDLMKIVESYTGDGNFKVAIEKNPATLRLNVRATGKSLSEVMPAGFFIPLGVIGLLTMSKESAATGPEIALPPSTSTAPPRPGTTRDPRPAPKPPTLPKSR